MAANEGGQSAGPATDRGGDPVVDPTKNVLDLVGAETKRQDDLRLAESNHLREVLELRAQIGEQNSTCSAEIAELRADHARDLREAEAARIDAIRQVDVEAVQRTANVQADQATALAAQVATTAEAMRSQVAAVASAAAEALGAALQPIMKDIADLRQAQYEAQGQKTQVTETQSASAVTAGGRGNTIAWVAAGIGGLFLFVSMIGTVVAILVALSGG